MAIKTRERTTGSGRRGPELEARPSRVWWRLYLHHLRLLRNAAIAWTLGLVGIGTGVIATFEDRYSTPEELAALEEMVGIPAFEALVGRYVEPATVEGLVLSRWSGMFAIAVAIWGMLAAVKLLRGAEEAGHVEPLRAGAVTPRGLLSSAMVAMFTVFGVFGLAIGLTHSAAGMDTATSWALAATMALVGGVFASLGALTSQLAASRRWAVGLAGVVLGVALAVRMVAATTGTPDWMWWTTPFGWTGFLHPSDTAQATVIAAFVSVLMVLVVAVFAVAQRDLHGGWVGGVERISARPRPVRGQGALAGRLTAASMAVWGAIAGLFALLFGLISRDFAEAALDMPTTVELFEVAMGWPGLDTQVGILAMVFSMFLGVVFGLFAAAQVSAMREEEASWRIEHLLVRPLGRIRWLVTRVGVAAAGSMVLAAGSGVAFWFGTVVIGSPLSLGDALFAGMNVLPLIWLFLGLGIAVFGLLPRLTAPLAYGLVLAAYLLDFVGGLLELPESVLELSPFRQLAAVPVVDFAIWPAVVMVVVGTAAAIIGAVAFRRRDLQEA